MLISYAKNESKVPLRTYFSYTNASYNELESLKCLCPYLNNYNRYKLYYLTLNISIKANLYTILHRYFLNTQYW